MCPKLAREVDRRQSRLDAVVTEIEALIQIMSGATRTDVHRQCKAAVSWLSRWAPVQLKSILMRIPIVREQQIALDL